MLNHTEIFQSADGAGCQFSHFCTEFQKGAWNTSDHVCKDNIKINIFVAGEFSLLVGDKIYEPLRGSFWVVSPLTVHCGNITKSNFIEYFQIDIGRLCLSALPHGKELERRLLTRCNVLFKPQSMIGEELIRLCIEAERKILNCRLAEAFAYIIILLGKLCDACTHEEDIASSGALSKTVSHAVKRISSYTEGKLTVSEIAEACHVSESYLSRMFRTEIGDTICNYLIRQRLICSVKALQDGEGITEISNRFGFSDASHYASSFKKLFGCTPTEYRKNRK